MIADFRELYDSYKDPEVGMAAFSIMYYMYHFKSHFLEDFPDEKERFKEVQKFVFKGTEVVWARIKIALETYKSLYDKEAVSTYLIMKANVEKLKEYAKRMTLVRVAEPSPDMQENGAVVHSVVDPDGPIYVDFKEFIAVNSVLPKQQEELDKYESRIIESVKNQIDVYGGGMLGAYEE